MMWNSSKASVDVELWEDQTFPQSNAAAVAAWELFFAGEDRHLQCYSRDPNVLHLWEKRGVGSILCHSRKKASF